MNKVLILGGYGHIGSYLAPMLVKAGYDVTCVSRGQSKPYTDDYAWQVVRHLTLDREKDEDFARKYQYVFALAHGAGKETFYYGDWIRKHGVAICSCNDGLRPVIFKLEATNEESKIDYEPVKE